MSIKTLKRLLPGERRIEEFDRLSQSAPKKTPPLKEYEPARLLARAIGLEDLRRLENLAEKNAHYHRLGAELYAKAARRARTEKERGVMRRARLYHYKQLPRAEERVEIIKKIYGAYLRLWLPTQAH